MIIYTGGSYDLFHWGHANFLAGCKQLSGDGGIVVVGLNTDEFIKEYKGEPPVMSFDERRLALLSCRYVDEVVPNIGDQDSRVTIDKLIEENYPPQLVVIGSDWHDHDYLKQMSFDWDWLRDKGIGVCYLPYTPKISSSDIKKRL